MHSVLKPSPLALLLFLLLLLVQSFLLGTNSVAISSSGETAKWRLNFGIGSPISVLTIDEQTTIEVNWLSLFINLALTYLFSLFVAWLFVKATRFKNPARVFWKAAVVTFGIAFILSISISKYYWGYFINRPAVLREIKDIESVGALIPIKTKSDPVEGGIVVPREEFSIEERIAAAKEHPYYGFPGRILIELEEADLLPNRPSHSLDGLPPLFPLIRETGMLAVSDEGYESSALVSGVVIDATSHSGQRLLFLSLNGPPVSNDHYAYYEMLFTKERGSPEYRYVRGHRFFYDVAGFEGMEWHGMWRLFSLLGILVVFPMIAIVCAIRNVFTTTGKAPLKPSEVAGSSGLIGS